MITRAKFYSKYRKEIENMNPSLINQIDVSYQPKHMFVKIEHSKAEIVSPTSEVSKKQEYYNELILKRNRRNVVVRLVLSLLILIGIAVFAIFAFM